MLYAVSERDNPTRIKVFEIYTDENAYKVHLETPHLKKFRGIAERMVKSRKILDAVPIILSAKAK
jgi:quinol monooxygenase YgiN